MVYTTGVSYIIATVLYTVIGFRFSSGSLDVSAINVIKSALAAQFNINYIKNSYFLEKK